MAYLVWCWQRLFSDLLRSTFASERRREEVAAEEVGVLVGLQMVCVAYYIVMTFYV